eukprot:456245_1
MLEFSSVEKGQRETSVWFRQCKKDLQRFKKDRTIRLNLLYISQENLPPRYSLTVRDTSGPSSGKNGLCAVFLVPQGRDSEWMFSSEEGQRTLCTDAGYKRFIIVVLNRGHKFSSLKDVQSELSPKMVQIAGRGTPSRSIPFMTIGGGIGSRKIIHEEVSEPSGRFFVEDVELDADSKSTRISRRFFRIELGYHSDRASCLCDPTRRDFFRFHLSFARSPTCYGRRTGYVLRNASRISQFGSSER